MPVTKTSRSLWILLIFIAVIGLFLAGTLSASNDTISTPGGWEVKDVLEIYGAR